MSKPKKPAAAVPFAHLLGIRAEDPKETDNESEELKAKRAEWEEKAEDDPERKQKEDESDEDYIKRMEEMDSEETKAEDDSEEAASNEKEGNDGEEAKAERARCSKIMAHGIKHGVAAQAGVFAFDTRMSVNAAISAMNATLSMSSRRTGLGDRMAGTHIPRVGAGSPAAHDPNDPQATAKATAARIIAAAAKARGETV